MPFDMDAARAARRAANGEAPSFTFGGKTFTLPVEPPLQLMEYAIQIEEALLEGNGIKRSRALLEQVQLLLGDQYDAFMAVGPSVQDFETFVAGAEKEYGFGPGESRASRRSSRPTSVRSKPTSKRHTA